MCRSIVFYSITIITLLFQTHTYAQTAFAPPAKINYQAIARNSLGHPMSNVTNLKVTFSIWDTIVVGAGNMLFTETHDSVTTNKYGLFTLAIGSKGPAKIDTLKWQNGEKFLEITIDSAGQNSVTFDRTQFMSVPYALHSKTAFHSFGNWSLVGNQTENNHFLGTNNVQDLVFKTNSAERMRINANGNIGIGTASPTALLTLQNMSTAGNEIEFLSTGSNADIHANSQLNIGTSQTLNFLTSGSTKLHISNTGFIGIGTTSPTASLEIAGQIKINGGSPGTGKVLVSNTNGLASWQSPNQLLTNGTGISISGNIINSVWTATNLGVDIFNNNTANVGIGTSNPSSKLDVNGTITISGSNTNELNRSQTGASNLVPIAYGRINANGTIISASTGNFTVNWDGGANEYQINLSNETYTSSSYISLVTPENDNFTASAKANSGLLIIKFFNGIGLPQQSPFQFIVYKP